MNRRELLQLAGLASAALTLPTVTAAFAEATLPSKRPPLDKRTFTSAAVEAKITEVTSRMRDRELAWLFANSWPNTLDTTIVFHERVAGTDGGSEGPDTFVLTGDIPAMWLRDSSAQLWAYLPLAARDPHLRALMAGLVRRHARCILLDPYANAFTLDPKTVPPAHDDLTEMRPGVWERKWEVDSLAYPMRFAHGYWRVTRDASPFDAAWRRAMRLAVATFREQQRKHGPGPYRFERRTTSPTETLWRGYGYPSRPIGLIHTGFRPSDDAGLYPFLIPSNFLAVQGLRGLATIWREALHDEVAAAEATALADEVRAALDAWATGPFRGHGTILAYEVDGYGNQFFMDDANVPNLLGLPYLGCMSANDPLYARTRRFILSQDNMFMFRGRVAEGLGGPHTGLGLIWPMGIVMQALTSTDDAEIKRCLGWLKATHANTGFIHESFDPDDPTKFTRPWFGWANSLFGELILDVYARRPHLLT